MLASCPSPPGLLTGGGMTPLSFNAPSATSLKGDKYVRTARKGFPECPGYLARPGRIGPGVVILVSFANQRGQGQPGGGGEACPLVGRVWLVWKPVCSTPLGDKAGHWGTLVRCASPRPRSRLGGLAGHRACPAPARSGSSQGDSAHPLQLVQIVCQGTAILASRESGLSRTHGFKGPLGPNVNILSFSKQLGGRQERFVH